jgi:spore maturation protein CgeB
MRIVLFSHSIVSDWSHGNAHFQRGLLRALERRGHSVAAAERTRSWSADNLVRDHGHAPVVEFARVFPDIDVEFYGGWEYLEDDLQRITRGADVVLVHEFSEPELVGMLGRMRRRGAGFLLLFHDTHHRAVSAPWHIERFNLAAFDGVLAFGDSLARVYREEYGQPRVWTFHEAADTSLFHPREAEREDDVVWIGNWGDEERSSELRAFLIDSARAMPDLRFAVHGVRYPEAGLHEIDSAGIRFRGWVPNFRVPDVFARTKLTLHVPRGPYLDRLPGIPTIRPFEALACGIPLVSTPWPDTERLFRAGEDFLMVHSPQEMRDAIRRLTTDEDARLALAECGLATIRAAHTCDHRAEQLESICTEFGI